MATFLSTSFEIMPLILQRRGRNRNKKKTNNYSQQRQVWNPIKDPIMKFLRSIPNISQGQKIRSWSSQKIFGPQPLGKEKKSIQLLSTNTL